MGSSLSLAHTGALAPRAQPSSTSTSPLPSGPPTSPQRPHPSPFHRPPSVARLSDRPAPTRPTKRTSSCPAGSSAKASLVPFPPQSHFPPCPAPAARSRAHLGRGGEGGLTHRGTARGSGGRTPRVLHESAQIVLEATGTPERGSVRAERLRSGMECPPPRSVGQIGRAHV